MDFRANLVTSILATFILICAGDASAQSFGNEPANCVDGDTRSAPRFLNQRMYRFGFRTGRSMVNEIWAELPDELRGRDRIDESIDIINAQIRQRFADEMGQEEVSERVSCLSKGALAGASEEVTKLRASIIDSCADDGREWGRHAAQIYCEMMAVFPDLGVPEEPVPTPDSLSACGTSFSSACRSGFEEEVQEYFDENGVSCLPYTTGEYLDFYLAERRLNCTF